MTNKDSIQQKHLDIILDYPSEVYASHKCTTVTADAIGEAMEWIDDNATLNSRNTWVVRGEPKFYTTAELVQLFLNQKSK